MEAEEADLVESLLLLLSLGGCERVGEAGLLGTAGDASPGGVSWSDSSTGREGRDFAGMRGVCSAESSSSVSGSCVIGEESGRVDGATFGVAWEL